MIIILIVLIVVALTSKKMVDVILAQKALKGPEKPKIQPEIGELGIPFREQIKEYLIRQEQPNYSQNNLFLGTAQI
jgi:hypothetical protein